MLLALTLTLGNGAIRVDESMMRRAVALSVSLRVLPMLGSGNHSPPYCLAVQAL